MAKTWCNQGFTFSVNTTPGTSSEVTLCSEVLTDNDDTGSKKLPKIDNELHSSTNAVLGNDDLLIEILLRLPVLSLHLFKSVSKNWLFLITSPSFSLRRRKIPKIDPPAGLLILRATRNGRKRVQFEYNFESFDTRIPSKRPTDFTLGSDALPGFVHIMHSCNDLLLCCIQPDTIDPDELYVCNPIIKLFKMLPTKSPIKRFNILPTNYLPASYVKIAFDPTKSPHYKVIHVKFDDDDDDGDGDDEFRFDYPQIATYSSEAGSWSLCGDRFPKYVFTGFNVAIYWNDALHWLMTTDYDDCTHCNLKIANEHLVLTKTELPGIIEGKLLESGGSMLLLSRARTDSKRLNVFEMKNGRPEWLYIVDPDDIMMPFPYPWMIYDNVWAIVPGEREEDSYMIIDLIRKVVQYNPMFKSLRTLHDLESVLNLKHFSSFHLLLGFDSANLF